MDMNSAIELPAYFHTTASTTATTATSGDILDLNNLMSIDHQLISFYDESNLILNHQNETFLIQEEEEANQSPILIDNYNNLNIDFEIFDTSDETFLCNIDKLLDENSSTDLSSPNLPTNVNDSSDSSSDSVSSPPPSSSFDSYFYGSDSSVENSLADTDIVSIDRKMSIKKVKTGRVSKKESNRAAALRYREKKQREREQLFLECEFYAKKNSEMRKKIDDTMIEISFIKSLLVEALVAKKSS
jgi:hypothetical protein